MDSKNTIRGACIQKTRINAYGYPADMSTLFVRYVICTEPNKYTFEHNGGSFSNVYVTLEHRDTSGLLALKIKDHRH
jgi:hypothetical protein